MSIILDLDKYDVTLIITIHINSRKNAKFVTLLLQATFFLKNYLEKEKEKKRRPDLAQTIK